MPDDGPATREAVKSRLEITDDDENSAIDDVVDAVNEIVRGLPIVQAVDAWPQRVVLGANMLAVRVYERSGTPDGTAQLTTAGPVYIERYDPDLAQLLRIGAYAKPVAR